MNFKLTRVAALLVLALVASGVFAQAKNPAEAIKEINDYRASTINEARQAQKQIDFSALNAAVLAKAKAAVEGVDAAKVEPKDGAQWAQLFQMAEMHKQACAAAERFLTTNPEPAAKFSAQLQMMNSCNELGEGHMLTMIMASIVPPTPNHALSLASSTAYQYAETIKKSLGVDAALKALDDVERLMPYDKMTDEREKPRADNVRATLASARAELLVDAGRSAEAMKVLDSAIAKLGDSPSARSVKGAKTRTAMMNSVAPNLSSERSHGAFAGLPSLKGKVVIVDFFAHWCGPCIASFPDMKQMYADLKDKGLEIVGVTTYYGYYKAENREKRDMSKDAEFAKMADFIAEHGLPWPVVYGERSNFDAYGVTGIPHVAVLDRDGKVHKIKIGYSKATFGAFRAEIEKMLGK